MKLTTITYGRKFYLSGFESEYLSVSADIDASRGDSPESCMAELRRFIESEGRKGTPTVPVATDSKPTPTMLSPLATKLREASEARKQKQNG